MLNGLTWFISVMQFAARTMVLSENEGTAPIEVSPQKSDLTRTTAWWYGCSITCRAIWAFMSVSALLYVYLVVVDVVPCTACVGTDSCKMGTGAEWYEFTVRR